MFPLLCPIACMFDMDTGTHSHRKVRKVKACKLREDKQRNDTMRLHEHERDQCTFVWCVFRQPIQYWILWPRNLNNTCSHWLFDEWWSGMQPGLMQGRSVKLLPITHCEQVVTATFENIEQGTPPPAGWVGATSHLHCTEPLLICKGLCALTGSKLPSYAISSHEALPFEFESNLLLLLRFVHTLGLEHSQRWSWCSQCGRVKLQG